MTIQPTHSSERIANWLEQWLSSHSVSGSPQLVLLAGDGSPRQFYRVVLPTATYVVMSDPSWGFSKDYAAHQGYLAGRGIPVPAFHHEDPENGLLLMEDLGDELLQQRLQKDPNRRLNWLKEAIKLLAQLHGNTFPVPGDLPVSRRRFDAAKYSEELAFTDEHLCQKFLGLPPATSELRQKTADFCAQLGEMKPDVFAHRDYHCRNLLVRGEKLFMIDFQDARLGPPHYDLASLLFDPYVGISAPERGELTHLYQKSLLHFPLGQEIQWASFQEDLERVAYQRLVKAAGSFASFYTRYGKTTHLPYLVPALRTARALKCAENLFPLDLWIQRATELAP